MFAENFEYLSSTFNVYWHYFFELVSKYYETMKPVYFVNVPNVIVSY